MELIEYVRSLRRNWWLVVVAAAVAAIVAYGSTSATQGDYRAEVRFVMGPAPLDDVADVIDATNTLDNRSLTTTFSEILTSDVIASGARDSSELGAEAADHYQFDSFVIAEANVVRLVVAGPRREGAAVLANEAAELAVDYFEDLYQVYEVNVLSPARVPGAASAPARSRNALVGLIGGAAGGFLLGLGLDRLRNDLADDPDR